MSFQSGSDPSFFSVVIPLHNKENSVGACLTSVLCQTIGNFELIVIDDGSTDGSVAVAASIDDPRLKLISRENLGRSATRNEGIEKSSAEFVAVLDADDEWLPDFLEAISRLINAHPDAGVYATAIAIDKGWGKHRLPVRGVPTHPWSGIVPDYYGTKGCLSASSTVIRRSLFQRAGLFNINMSTGEDLDLWFRLAAYTKVAYTTEIQAVWHYAGEDHTSKYSPPIVPSGFYSSLAALLADDTLSEKTKSAATQYVASVTLRETTLLAQLGRRREARAALSEWRRRNGMSLRWIIVRLFTEAPIILWRCFLGAKRLATRTVVTSLPRLSNNP